MLKIGGTLNLELIQKKTTNTSDTYRCKIIEKNNQYIWIDYPINDTTHRTTYLTKGTQLMVSFVGDDNAIYTFRTTLIQKDTLNNVPAFLLYLPKTMKRVQRRDHVRVETALDIAIQCNDRAPFTCVTKDISGGGVAVIIPLDENLDINSFVDVYIVLPTSTNKITYIETSMKVIRIMYQSKIPVVSMQFIGLSNKSREQIMQHCFEKQREQRIMELK